MPVLVLPIAYYFCGWWGTVIGSLLLLLMFVIAELECE